MDKNRASIISKAAWTIGSYGASSAIRLVANVALSHLLTPAVLGILVVVNSSKVGVELLTDVGIEQNVVANHDSDNQHFLNTAWTMQIARGAILSGIFLLISPLLATLYHIDVLVFVAVSVTPLINSCHSIAIFLLSKRLEVRRRNTFELTSEVIGLVANITLAILFRSVWGPIFGMIFTVMFRTMLSYSLPGPVTKIELNLPAARGIIRYGKWIAASSLLVYFSSFLDRLYLGNVVPLSVLGVYGLARTIADLPPTLAGRLSYQLIFPFLAAARSRGDMEARASLERLRWRFVLSLAIGIAVAIVCADWAITLLYDARYRQAGWMLFALLVGSWFAVLSNLNEATLLSFSAPAYNSLSNAVRFGALAVGLPVGHQMFGIAGAIGSIVTAEACRYVCVAIGQTRVGASFIRQDIVATAVGLIAVAILTTVREAMGLGVPWQLMLIGK